MSKHTVNTETEPESFGEELDRRVAAQEQARRPKAAQPAQSHRRRPAPRKNDNSYTIGDFLHDERFHYAIGIIICFIAIVTAVCCFSFIYSTNADQSLTLNKTVAEVAAASDMAGERVNAYYYPDGLPECVGEYAGIAQQYLFDYARTDLKDTVFKKEK